MRLLGHPILVGGGFDGRHHPGVLTPPQPPSYSVLTNDPYARLQKYTKRLGMLGKSTLLVYYAHEDMGEEESWERLMETVIERAGFEAIKA